MKPYKAPGPDGFQCIFFKQYWHIVKEDIFNLMSSAFHTGYFDPDILNTLISLIPKIDSSNTYKDFRPINLCNIVYKIITKVLVHRLRPVLDTILLDPTKAVFYQVGELLIMSLFCRKLYIPWEDLKRRKDMLLSSLTWRRLLITSIGIFSSLPLKILDFLTSLSIL